MNITFIGATGTVTGSKYLVEGSGRLLVDCGLFQGYKQLRLRNRAALPVDPRALDAVILTHAHLDHSGYLPLLVKNGYRGKVFCTEATRDQLADAINRTATRAGVMVVPSFAVGRAQMLLWHIHALKTAHRIPDLPVYLNSPMAADVTRVYETHHDEHRLTGAQVAAMCRAAKIINTVDESKALNTLKGAAIIIAGSGMATGGRVIHHLKAYAPDKRNTILLTGFQAGGTRGASLLDGAETIKIHGEQVPVRAEVVLLDNVSAHADYAETLDWLGYFRAPPRMTFLTHGEPDAADALRRRIEERFKWRVEVPAYLEQVSLT